MTSRIGLAPCASGARCPLASGRGRAYRTTLDCPACALAHMDAEGSLAHARLEAMGPLDHAGGRGGEVSRRLTLTAAELRVVVQSADRARCALTLTPR